MERHAPQGKEARDQQRRASKIRIAHLPEQRLYRAVHRQIGSRPIISRAERGEEFRHDRAPIRFPFRRDRARKQAFAHIGCGKARDLFVPRNGVILEQPIMARPGD